MGAIIGVMAESSDSHGSLDDLYERFVRPLESSNWGRYVAVRKDGSLVLGDTLLEVMKMAHDQLGAGITAYKVGEIAVGNLR
jgi:hypothetical protein